MIGFIEKNQNLSRKEREKLLKKHEILSAATKLFAEQGYDKTTLDEIAEAAEFGKGTIYNYFKNKEEIYKAILFSTMSNYQDLLVEIDKRESDFKEFIKSLMLEMYRFCEKDRDTFNLFVRMRTDYSVKDTNCNHEDFKEFSLAAFKIFDRRIKSAIKIKQIIEMDTYSFMNLYRSMVFPYIYFMMINSDKEIDFNKEAEFVLSVLFNGILVK